MDDFSILISGASVSGLSAAYWLSRYGFKVTVVEREPHLRPGGQALDVRGAAALEVAERMGISAELRERSTKLHGMSIVDRTGREIFRSTERSFTGGDFASSDVEILRDDLCAVLHAAVGDRAEYLFDDSIASLNTDETGVDVAFVNGEPRRFDLVVGADGMRSNVRRLVFGPDQKFIRYLGNYIGVFGAPNFLGLDHWQTFCMEGEIVGGVLALAKDADMRVYLGFASEQPVDYDYHDIAAQKQLLAACGTGASWVFPELIAHMQAAPDFYFDSTSQIRMDHWSHGRVVLLGDAGYSVSVATGQGTSVAMIAAYVLAGELAMHRREPVAGIIRYEHELRDYVSRNQDLVDVTSHALPEPTGDDGLIDPDSLADFGKIAVPFDLKSYEQVTRA